MRKLKPPAFRVSDAGIEVNEDEDRLDQREYVAEETDRVVAKIMPLIEQLKSIDLDSDGTHWSDSDIVGFLNLYPRSSLGLHPPDLKKRRW